MARCFSEVESGGLGEHEEPGPSQVSVLSGDLGACRWCCGEGELPCLGHGRPSPLSLLHIEGRKQQAGLPCLPAARVTSECSRGQWGPLPPLLPAHRQWPWCRGPSRDERKSYVLRMCRRREGASTPAWGLCMRQLGVFRPTLGFRCLQLRAAFMLTRAPELGFFPLRVSDTTWRAAVRVAWDGLNITTAVILLEPSRSCMLGGSEEGRPPTGGGGGSVQPAGSQGKGCRGEAG